VLGAARLVGKRFERPAAEESSARAERLSRLVDVLTVLKGRLFPADNVTLSPTTLEFYGWPPICSPASVINLLLLSRLFSLRTGSGGPTTDRTSTRYSRFYNRRLQSLLILLRR
jgi:hypothetical protein